MYPARNYGGDVIYGLDSRVLVRYQSLMDRVSQTRQNNAGYPLHPDGCHGECSVALPAHFVCGVMVDVHIWVRSPTLKDPVDKSLECALFLGPVMCPPILEL
jgi:hypothetical protein